MTGTAADTWGISGPRFLALYGALMVGGLIVTLIVRRILVTGAVRPGAEPGAEEIAYFNGGARQAVAATLAGLHTAQAISVQHGATSVVGPPPPAPSALTWAAYQALQRGVRARALVAEPGARGALGTIRDTLIRNGWLLTPARRAAVRTTFVIMAAVTGLGVARIVAGIQNGKPVTFILPLTIVSAVLTLPFLAAGHRTPAGSRAMAAIRARNLHLSPSSAPALAMYGAGGAALSVGLFGAAALWAADPALAAEANFLRTSTSGTGSSSCGGSSGDSGGGGGGCGGGGGGCGGGGGGCGG